VSDRQQPPETALYGTHMARRAVHHAPGVTRTLEIHQPSGKFLCGQLDVMLPAPDRPAQRSSVSLEDTGETGHHNRSQEPANETEPKGPHGRRGCRGYPSAPAATP
jgi:hypothetical protein